MLEIYPIKDAEIIKTRFADNGLDFTDCSAGYIAYDGGEEIGCCLFDVIIAEKHTNILLITPADDNFLCDSLIRSIINYSANRGVFSLVCANDEIKNIASRLSYLAEVSNEIDVAGMMQGCKNCKNK